MTSTPKEVLFLVVSSVVVFTGIGVVSLALVMFFKIEPHPVILQAMITMTGNLGGVLTGMLINTRQPTTAVKQPEGEKNVS